MNSYSRNVRFFYLKIIFVKYKKTAYVVFFVF